jgi:hypothetical protein
MRLSDAGFRRLQTKLIYPDHQPPPWLTEDATRDRSNRFLDATRETLAPSQCSIHTETHPLRG